ncbi:MAG: SRPBCC domain-containing protein [Planctomycetaceae bacterium]|nr:SRPBCC domain-containing protein [Planctomycetaceae bacterium]
MAPFRQNLTLRAAPDVVFAALTTPRGLAGWWSEDCDVPTGAQQAPGATVRVRFDCAKKDFRIERLEPGRALEWLCTAAYLDLPTLERRSEWVGTRLRFQLSAAAEGATELAFEHEGLEPTLECFELCRAGWQQFLGSLQRFVETGRGEPYRLGVRR